MNELKEIVYEGNPQWRFPANIILDEEAGRMLDEQSGELKSGELKWWASRFFYCAKASKKERNAGYEELEEKQVCGDNGGTYQWLSDSKKKSSNSHPTVKPLKLMEYLCTLTKTPTWWVVLDPFAWSGTTGLACKNTGRDCILIEREEDYIKIIEKRLQTPPSE
jgi:DNA modification methylase